MKRISTFFMAAAICVASSAQKDYAAFVNEYIGTGGHGHTHPAAMVPHGMVQPGPDTRHHGWDACSGYYYEDKTINGFSQLRLSGTGCGDLSDFLLMPLNERPDLRHVGEKSGQYRCPWASSFWHEQEEATPGYYSVFLRRYGVQAEVTATERTALYRFKYTQRAGKRTDAAMLLDLDYNNQHQYMLDMEWEQVGDRKLRAYHRSQGWAYNQPVYFFAEFSHPFTVEEVRDTVSDKGRTYPRCKLILTFKADGEGVEPDEVMVKSAISFCDYKGAERNLYTEQPAWDFEGTRRVARRKWNEVLSKIDIRDLGNAAADSMRTIFYTALYHANIAPNLFCDVDGRYLGMDLNIHKCDPVKDPMYTVFSLWDTFRALHPLVSIIDPARNEAYIRSLVQKGEEGGIVPKWELEGNYTGCMIGYHYVSLLADMYTKGYRNYDVEKAYRHALRCAEYDTTGITQALPRWKMGEIMPEARYWKNKLGYIPCDKTGESVAKALEYAYNDWCIAQIAKGQGDKATQKRYENFAKAYRHYFDPSQGFMRGKKLDGSWRTPFSPTSSDHRMDDYTEGNAWQWTFFAPHDPQGLMKLFGSKEKFVAKLDSLFTSPSILTGDNVSPDISGLIGQYAHGNEPSHATIFLYNYMGQPWKTQELVDSVLYNLYFDGPMGLSGNEDCGQMSAWYILNAMGFYQPCPGKPEYAISRPLFGEVCINLPGGKTFVVKTINNSRRNKYVKSMKLNGKALKTPFFTHAQLAAGGVLEIEMTDRRPR